MRRLSCLALALIPALLLARPAAAAERDLHFDVRAAALSGWPDMFAVFAEARVMPRVRVELGLGGSPLTYEGGGFVPTAALRGKFSLVQLQSRSRTHQLDLAAGLGVRWLDGLTHDVGVEPSAHAMYTYWLRDGLGFELQASAGAPLSIPPTHQTRMMSLGLSAGLAF